MKSCTEIREREPAQSDRHLIYLPLIALALQLSMGQTTDSQKDETKKSVTTSQTQIKGCSPVLFCL